MREGHKIALLIANADYQDRLRFPPLMAPTKDVDALAEALSSPGIGGFDVQKLINEPCAKIKKEIEVLFKNKKKEDLLLLYFSGHGAMDKRNLQRLYLIGKDTEEDYLESTAISAAFIRDVMGQSHSKRQVLILDCCYSGAAFLPGAKNTHQTADDTASLFLSQGEGHVILSASSAQERAWEDVQKIGEVDNSIFTHHLVQGLRTGEADRNNDGWITLDEWYDYVYEQVTMHPSPKKQRPGRSSSGYGQIVIAKNPHQSLRGPIPYDEETALVWPKIKPATASRVQCVLAISIDGATSFPPPTPHVERAWDMKEEPSTLWDVLGQAIEAAGEGALFAFSNACGIAISPNAAILATGNIGSTVKLWQTQDGRLLSVLKHRGFLNSLAFSPDGTLLACGASTGSPWLESVVQIWRVSDGRLLHTLEVETGGFFKRGGCSIVWSPDGKMLASTCTWSKPQDNIIRLWAIEDGHVIHRLSGHNKEIIDLAWSSDGNILTSIDDDCRVCRWRIKDGAKLSTRTLSKHTEAISKIILSPDGEVAASLLEKGTVGNFIGFGVHLDELEDEETSLLNADVSDVSNIAFSHDRKILALGLQDGTIKLLLPVKANFYTSSDEIILSELKGHGNSLIGMMFSRDGSGLASVSEDGTVRLWRVS